MTHGRLSSIILVRGLLIYVRTAAVAANRRTYACSNTFVLPTVTQHCCSQTDDRHSLELKLCAAADVRKLLGAKNAATGVAALTVFSCLAGGDYDQGADRIGPKHAADVVSWLLFKLPKVCVRCRGVCVRVLRTSLLCENARS